MECGRRASESVDAEILYDLLPEGTEGGANERILRRYLDSEGVQLCDECNGKLLFEHLAAWSN